MAQSTVESLNLAVSVYKSLLSDYALRALQAEEMATQLMSAYLKPSSQQIAELVNKHVDERLTERNSHYVEIINATILALSFIQKNSTDQETKERLATIIHNLSLTQVN